MLAELRDDFAREEPQNGALLHDFARGFCRVSGRNAMVLQQTRALQEQAVGCVCTALYIIFVDGICMDWLGIVVTVQT